MDRVGIDRVGMDRVGFMHMAHTLHTRLLPTHTSPNPLSSILYPLSSILCPLCKSNTSPSSPRQSQGPAALTSSCARQNPWPLLGQVQPPQTSWSVLPRRQLSLVLSKQTHKKKIQNFHSTPIVIYNRGEGVANVLCAYTLQVQSSESENLNLDSWLGRQTKFWAHKNR